MNDPARHVVIDSHGMDLPLEDDGVAPPVGRDRMADMLGFLVHKALVNDLMLKMRFEIDPASNVARLRFFGPVRYPEERAGEERRWWDLYPPSIQDYPFLLQHLVSIIDPAPALPMQGTVQALCGARRFLLAFRMISGTSFELEWPEEEAWAAAESYYPENSH